MSNVVLLRGGASMVAAGDLLGQVLGEIANAAVCISGPGEHALGVELGPEPRHVQWRGGRADGVQSLVPARQYFAGVTVDVVAGCLMPDRQLVVLVPDAVGCWPPHLVIGGRDDLPQIGAGDSAAECDVRVRGQTFLRLDDSEVLDVVAEVAAQVLDEPVEERGEMDRVTRRPLVVVATWVGGCAVS